MLILFGGLPGTGKTTIARQVADRLRATYLRIDAIEQALRSSNGLGADVGPTGYEIAYAVAEANLGPGRIVVADCVNPVPVTRAAWRAVTARAKCPIMEVELVCSDAEEHRRRVECREIDITGMTPPSWADVQGRAYAPWAEARIRIDTAKVSPHAAVRLVLEEIGQSREP